MKVIIAGTSAATGAKLEQQIRDWGYETALAAGGREALAAAAAEHRPAIVLAGPKLPDIAGPELCARLRRAKAASKLYILLLAPKDDKETLARSLESGADDYVAKAAEGEELRSRLAIGRRILEYQDALDNLSHELQAKNRELGKKQTIDGLTGIPGRRHFEEKLGEEWRRAWREGSPLSLLLLDIDAFKAYNDTYGHLAGDECLKKVASTLIASIGRAGDLAARFGGEEFAAVLPATDGLGAMVVAEAVRVAVAALDIGHRAAAHDRVTVSVGTATVYPDGGKTANDLIILAEAALYRAKAAGRNNVKQA